MRFVWQGPRRKPMPSSIEAAVQGFCGMLPYALHTGSWSLFAGEASALCSQLSCAGGVR